MPRAKHRKQPPRPLCTGDLVATHVQEPDQLVSALTWIADQQAVNERERGDDAIARAGDQDLAAGGAADQLGGGGRRGVELGEADETWRVGLRRQVDLSRPGVGSRLMRRGAERREAVGLSEGGMNELEHGCHHRSGYSG